MSRCLDLHALHSRYINSKFGQQDQEYLDYVSSVTNFDQVSKLMRSSQPYR